MTELNDWLKRILYCKALDEIKSILSDFSEHFGWTLTERATISSAYIPRAMKLLSNMDGYEKWNWLEDLAEVCWAANKETDVFSVFGI